MAYNSDETTTITTVAAVSSIVTAILILILVFLRGRNLTSSTTIQVCLGVFLFVVVLPALILSTLANAVMLETQEAIDVPCPSYCRTRGTGRSVSNINSNTIAIGTISAIVIGVGLWFAHRAQVARLRYDTILKIYAFIFAVLLFPGLIVSTTVSSTMREDIQLIMGGRDCSRCRGTSVG